MVTVSLGNLFISRVICRTAGGCSSTAATRWCRRTSTAHRTYTSTSPKARRRATWDSIAKGARCQATASAKFREELRRKRGLRRPDLSGYLRRGIGLPGRERRRAGRVLPDYAKLQPQDYDNDVDVYDAHECTVASPCFPTPVPQPPACTSAEACRAAPTPQPGSFGAPSSATFSGLGNTVPGSGTSAVKAKPLTRAQKLARALKTCKKETKEKASSVRKRAQRSTAPRRSP